MHSICHMLLVCVVPFWDRASRVLRKEAEGAALFAIQQFVVMQAGREKGSAEAGEFFHIARQAGPIHATAIVFLIIQC
jgi:hypothetical protein